MRVTHGTGPIPLPADVDQVFTLYDELAVQEMELAQLLAQIREARHALGATIRTIRAGTIDTTSRLLD